MKLATYNTEIEAIMHKHTNSDRGMAVDMFLNNIKDEGDPNDQYKHPGNLGFDYNTLKPYLKELEEDKVEHFGYDK